ncbi:tyrosine-type recombinase/integrase [Aeromonas hydrophila]|nr:hypothetical protein B7E00_16850 [Aeromonas hydrophila]CAD7531416.1 integrase [Aeromonas hydrophila]CAD7533671.1 integrase [Aeromonas hydrophila]CAD7533867.1 integrase [Aeromonas hydrophila]CAD7537917.1 integrase [Aeromonas hydrophila]
MIRTRGKSWQVDVEMIGKQLRRTAPTFTETCNLEATMKDMLELTWSRFWTHQKNGKGSKQRALIVLEDMEWMDLRPAEITRNSLLKVCDFYLNKGNKCATVNRKNAAISKLLSTALDEELISHKPVIPHLREMNARTRFISLAEEEALLCSLCELGYVAECHLVQFLLDTGCRVGEALALHPGTVDRHSKSVLFEDTKNGTSRMIPLTDRALDSALKWGAVKSTSGFSQKFNRARNHARLSEDVTPHVMRHTCASRLAQSGISVVIIKAWLGHKTIRMTDRYAHLDTSNLLVAKDVLDKFGKK